MSCSNSKKRVQPLGGYGLAIATMIAIPLLPALFFYGISLIWKVDPPELLVDEQYRVGDYVVNETIHVIRGWPDARGHRRYTVQPAKSDTDAVYELGLYENEAMTGISAKTPPRMEDDWLVVFSSNYVYLWQPNIEPIEFSPYSAENWYDVFEDPLSAPNGHYDYVAEQFSIEESGQWQLTYRCIAATCGQNTVPPKPEILTFRSDNKGVNFYLEEPLSL